ncbi:MAG: ATP-dependent Clp protease proteolytic subunit [Eubacterium sp.]
MLSEITSYIDTPKGDKQIGLFSRLHRDRIIFCFDAIDDDVAQMVVAQLLALDALGHEDIHLYINSPGGGVTAGLAIIDAMDLVTSDVCTYGIGSCASMGAMLLAAGTQGKRHGLKHCEIMIHQVLGTVSGQATDVEITADQLKKTKNQLNMMLAAYTGQPIDKIKRDTERDYYMNAEKALAYGLVDEVL